MNLTWAKIKDYVYVLTLIGVGCGWYIENRVTKAKNEMKDIAQDATIAAQTEEIRELKKELREVKIDSQKNKGYAKENANSIDWLTAIAGLDVN